MSTNRDALVERVAEARANVQKYLDTMLLPSEVRSGKNFDLGGCDGVPLWSNDIRTILDALPELAQAQAAVERVEELCANVLERGYGSKMSGRDFAAEIRAYALAGPEQEV